FVPGRIGAMHGGRPPLGSSAERLDGWEVASGPARRRYRGRCPGPMTERLPRPFRARVERVPDFFGIPLAHLGPGPQDQPSTPPGSDQASSVVHGVGPMGRLCVPRPLWTAVETDRSVRGRWHWCRGYFPSPSTLVSVHLLAGLQNFVNFCPWQWVILTSGSRLARAES